MSARTTISMAEAGSLNGIRTPATSQGAPARRGAWRQIGTVTAREFGDRLRSGWVIACMLVWLGAIGLTSVFGLLQLGRIGMQGYERTVVSLLNLVQYVVPLLGLLLGHDLIVSELEERTLQLTIAAGVTRTRLLAGKFFGGALVLGMPLLLGFAIAGSAIGFSAKDNAFGPFLKLAGSGLALGITFLGVGIVISTFSRTRVQSLVLALLAWCVAVFVFDLVALGIVIATKSPVAAQEIEVVCDAIHVNAAADPHAAYDNLSGATPAAARSNPTPSLGWLAINPVDVFRAVNLPRQMEITVPAGTLLATATLWILGALGVSLWKLRRTDL